MVSPSTRLSGAIARAKAIFADLAQGGEALGYAFEITDEPAFEASVSYNNRIIFIAAGAIAHADRLLTLAKDAGGLGAGTAADLADHALTWLCLHELMHARLGHGLFHGAAGLVEVSPPRTHHLPIAPDVTSRLTPDEQPNVYRCLELQADSEATDVFLSGHDADGPQDLHRLGIAVFTVMMLIERENNRLGNLNLTHPSAATRLFTLTGQLFQLSMMPDANFTESGDAIEVPVLDEARFDRFARDVFMPVINDAIVVAAAADANGFLEILGDGGALFQDLFTVQTSDDLRADDLHTPAAREWLELMPLNAKLLHMLGHR